MVAMWRAVLFDKVFVQWLQGEVLFCKVKVQFGRVQSCTVVAR